MMHSQQARIPGMNTRLDVGSSCLYTAGLHRQMGLHTKKEETESMVSIKRNMFEITYIQHEFASSYIALGM